MSPEPDPHSIRMSLYKRDFEEERENAAEELRSDVTSPAVRALARLRVREHFERDLNTHNQEKLQLPEYESNEVVFSVIDGQVTYLNRDSSPSKYTLSSLHERHLTDKKSDIRDSYSADTHKLDLLVQSIIVSAKEKVEVMKQVDDIKGFRDIYKFVYDPVTNRGKLIVYSQAPEGGFKSVEDVHKKMYELLPDSKQISSEKNMVLVKSVGKIDEQAIHREYTKQVTQMFVSRKVKLEFSTSTITTRDIQQPVAGVVREIQVTADSVQKYFERKKEAVEQIKPETVKLQMSEQKPITAVFKKMLVAGETSNEFPLLTEDILLKAEEASGETSPVERWKKRAEEVLRITPEQTQQMVETIEKAHAAMEKTKTIVLFATKTETKQVAIPAALVALDLLAHPENFIEDTGLKEDEVQITPQITEAVLAFFSAPEDASFAEFSEIDMTALTWVKPIIEKINTMDFQKATEVLEHEEEVVILKMSDLLEVFTDITNKMNEKQDITKPKEHAVQFSFAVTLWFLLKYHSYYRSLSALKDFVCAHKEDKRPLVEKFNGNIPEGLVQKEPAQWALLAIIYQLAMLREAGVYQTKKGNKKTKKKKMVAKKTFPLPSRGVIFAFTS